jgi:hypothetical protein
MIEFKRFEELIQKIEAMTNTISVDEIKRDLVIREWHERFGHLDYFLFVKAVDLLIDNHDKKKFPLVSEMFASVRLAREAIPVDREINEAECPRCHGQGLVITLAKDSCGVAKPCNCKEGQSYERGWKAHDRRNRK